MIRYYLSLVLDFILFVWQLPQNLAGLLFLAFIGKTIPVEYRGEGIHRPPPTLLYFTDRMKGGITLGKYVFLSGTYFTDFRTWQHERGHSIQSMILGPLYLFVIGIPSLLWAAWWNPGRSVTYYWFYTERWADKLGGAERC